MSKSVGFTTRGVLGAMVCLALTVAPIPATAAPAAPESSRIPFKQRYRATYHGGIVRAANSAITCRSPKSSAAASCSAVKKGAAGANSDFDMFYVDVDDDPNTYNSSRAQLAVPKNSRVRYARLYWGGNLRVGEQKPPKDNGRILIAEPGGEYKEVLADTRVAHRDADGSDAFQASADVTPLVRRSGSGLYTVAQINVAMGHSKVGSWGGWTLVVAYENSREPKRHLAIWDGFETLNAARKNHSLTVKGLRIPARAGGRAGFVSYDGDRGLRDGASVRAGNRKPVALTNSANPANDAMNSTITDVKRPGIKRQPSYVNTLGYDSDVFDIKRALTSGGGSLTFRFSAESRGYFLGALFLQADSRR
ncbi:DUF3344 domain-containing protein [Streptomyces sp. NBC_01142]|uniref:DUF3344 domain-containing protein n=1 Tax=Streptomyces sp. NBC_01142 TaxID=2975865 RepID=UPI00225099EB|nr:DUF3344 domain-containing protein [Streptomyces sp. NBC_01142]MCX4819040.1 DUF3344 domain-containing protein [Streptomyces sp. NBC_01142]